MAQLATLTFVCVILAGASAIQFDVKDKNNKTCIHGKTELSLVVTYNKTGGSTGTYTLKPITKPKVTGMCGNATNSSVLNISFPVNGHDWEATWTFSEVKDSVQLTILNLMYFTDSKTFPNATDQNKSLNANSKLNVALAPGGQYFQCHSGLHFVVENVNITQTKFEVEPFVKNGNPSNKSTLCDGDKSTTVTPAITTQAPTTPITTQAPTPAPVVAEYVVKDTKGNACLLADIGFTFTISYNQTTNNTAMATLEMLNATVDKVNSKCATNTSQEATLALKFGKNELTLTFNSTNKQAKLQSLSLMYDADNAIFKNASKDFKGMRNASRTDLNFMLSSVDKHFECKRSLPENIDPHTWVNIQATKVQAYMVKNNYSLAFDECIQDKKLPDQPAPGNFSAYNPNNKTYCIVANMGMRVIVQYMNKDKKKVNATVDVLQNQTTSDDGMCGNDTQELVLKFFNGWSATFAFAKNKANRELKNVSLIYVMDDHFLEAPITEIGTVMSAANNSLSLFSAPLGQGYTCQTDKQEVRLDDVYIDLYKLKIQSFRTTNKTDFTNSLIECASDQVTNSIVPIAVGAALAGLVVIVLIAYLIGRRRSHKGYQSV